MKFQCVGKQGTQLVAAFPTKITWLHSTCYHCYVVILYFVNFVLLFVAFMF